MSKWTPDEIAKINKSFEKTSKMIAQGFSVELNITPEGEEFIAEMKRRRRRETWNRIGRSGMILLCVAFCAVCWFVVLRTAFGTRAWVSAMAAIVFGCVTFGTLYALIEYWTQ